MTYMEDNKKLNAAELQSHRKKTRNKVDSPFVDIFSKKWSSYMLDAVLRFDSNRMLTINQWANKSGVPRKKQAEEILKVLYKYGVVYRNQDNSRYGVNKDSPTLANLRELNRLLSEVSNNPDMKDEWNGSPKSRYSYWCPHCNNKGSYQGRKFERDLYSCDKCDSKWAVLCTDPPEFIESFLSEVSGD